MNDGRSIIVSLAIASVFAYLLRGFLGKMSSLFFVPIDQLLFISNNIPPVLMWMVLGLLIGLIYGSFVSIKKFRLDYKLLIYPGLTLVIGLSLILLASFVVEKFNKESENKVTNEVLINGKKQNYLSPTELARLNQILNEGILAVENERYESAVELFIKAASISKGDPRLDSLATQYKVTGDDKCQLFRNDSQLKYIPNNYYKYVAALTNTTPQVCN